MLARYVGLRFLTRLAASTHSGAFLLKGATLFLVWEGRTHRPTRDIDLLGFAEPDEANLAQIVRDICLQEVEPDGVAFDPNSIKTEMIREGNAYGGIRCKVIARIGPAKQNLQIDVGFGDAIIPEPVFIEIPRLLADQIPATMRAYRPETAIAEKFDAMICLGLANSRMKDFFDIHRLCATMDFDGDVLSNAIKQTFLRRGTQLPEETPIALTDAFWSDPIVVRRWHAFLQKNDLPKVPLEAICAHIRKFLEPAYVAARNEIQLQQRWTDGDWTQI